MTLPRPCPRCGAPGCRRHHVDVKKIRNAETTATAAQVARSPRCSCCGATEDLTAGHRIPVSLGGRAADGLDTLCRPCNSSAGAGGACQLDHEGAR